MNATGTITMTMRELDRYKVIQAVADGVLRPWRAAERLGLTTRQIRRLVGRLQEHGPGGLVSGRRSKPSNNRLDAATADRVLAIIVSATPISGRRWPARSCTSATASASRRKRCAG
ncbi:hypothetical protein BN2476_990001 [Paraburkholderia piptadeniae]|uniref:Transposase n=1 Tax=Paraburkholderia piptadeniae TaxID=1701573 RepID=A0A1N7SU71_9BURK|nr:hypothetical protein BN2476_990001 [Paraburkholderia piptadeniae]